MAPSMNETFMFSGTNLNDGFNRTIVSSADEGSLPEETL